LALVSKHRDPNLRATSDQIETNPHCSSYQSLEANPSV
jgi:hypothetical protein